MIKNNYDISASLRISSKVLDVSDITNILDLKPKKTLNKGEIISFKSPIKRLRQESKCLYDSGLESDASLDEHLAKLTNLLEIYREQFVELLNDCSRDICCSYTTYSGQGGIALDHNLYPILNEFKVDIYLDLFSIEDS